MVECKVSDFFIPLVLFGEFFKLNREKRKKILLEMEKNHFPLKENIQVAYLTKEFSFTIFCELQWSLCGK